MSNDIYVKVRLWAHGRRSILVEIDDCGFVLADAPLATASRVFSYFDTHLEYTDRPLLIATEQEMRRTVSALGILHGHIADARGDETAVRALELVRETLEQAREDLAESDSSEPILRTNAARS